MRKKNEWGRCRESIEVSVLQQQGTGMTLPGTGMQPIIQNVEQILLVRAAATTYREQRAVFRYIFELAINSQLPFTKRSVVAHTTGTRAFVCGLTTPGRLGGALESHRQR